MEENTTTKTEHEVLRERTIAISLALEFANKAEPTEEDLEYIQQLAVDALQEQPQTPEGAQIRERLLVELANGEDSEYTKKSNFVASVTLDKIYPSVVDIYKLIGKHAESLNPANKESGIEALVSDIVTMLDEKEVPYFYHSNIFALVSDSLTKAKTVVLQQEATISQEMISIISGVRSPENNTLSYHLSTLKHLRETREKLREQHGVSEKDYTG